MPKITIKLESGDNITLECGDSYATIIYQDGHGSHQGSFKTEGSDMATQEFDSLAESLEHAYFNLKRINNDTKSNQSIHTGFKRYANHADH